MRKKKSSKRKTRKRTFGDGPPKSWYSKYRVTLQYKVRGGIENQISGIVTALDRADAEQTFVNRHQNFKFTNIISKKIKLLTKRRKK